MLVVLAADDNYAKYVAVTVASVMDHHTGDGMIDFCVLHRDITPTHQEMLASMSDERHHIRCVNVSGRLDSSMLYTSGYITEETYYRLLIPDLFPEDSEALYLDCDLICQADLETIWPEMTLSGDEWVSGTLAANLEAKNVYTSEYLGIPSDTYINAGVTMMNLEALRQARFLEVSLAFIQAHPRLDQHDQDVLNAVCHGHVKVLDHHVHMTVGARANALGKTVQELTLSDLDLYFLHYAANKAWKSEMSAAMLPYWHYVGETPFAEEIVTAYREISDTRRRFRAMCANNQVSLGYLMGCLKDAIGARVHR